MEKNTVFEWICDHEVRYLNLISWGFTSYKRVLAKRVSIHEGQFHEGQFHEGPSHEEQ